MPKDMYLYLTYLDENNISKLKEISNFPPYKGFVLNANKISYDTFNSLNLPIKQDKDIPYLYRYNPDDILISKSIYHELGAIYIMDPSSCLVLTLIENTKHPKIVLDLCSAPGGKTISYALSHPNDLIIANDYSYKRALELKNNIHRIGLDNVIVTSLDPSYLQDNFPSYFDVILLDVPCSSSGMFRKEKKMEIDWSYKKVESLLPIQKDLLDKASSMLKDGGQLIYSTCSFLKEEDEDQIASFLNNHTEFSLKEIPMKKEYFSILEGTIHLFPYLFQGEGHFIANLIKKGNLLPSNFKQDKIDNLTNLYLVKLKETYLIKYIPLNLNKLNPIYLGIQKSNNEQYAKCEFDISYARYLKDTQTININEEEAIKYIKGEQLNNINQDIKDGLNILSYNGINIAFASKKGNIYKNLYPKYLRKSIYPINSLIKTK